MPDFLIATDQHLLESLADTLTKVKAELGRLANRERELAHQAEQRRLLTEAEACAYLGRDAVTLRYYRTAGLTFYKKGRDVWYTKGDIDEWLASGRVNRHRAKDTAAG